MTGSSPRRHGLAAILIIEVVGFWLANLPTWLDFPAFAFGDLGASLTTQDLVARGYRPGIDFAHHYGLLPIAIGRVWFGLVGSTPGAFYAFMGLTGIGMAWSLAEIAHARGIAREGKAILVLGAPFFIQSCYPNLAHALEAALLCQALAEQSKGRRGSALAWATLAVFSKPSLGLAYGFVLVVIVAGRIWTGDRIGWAKSLFGRDAFGPAILTAVVGLLLLIGLYGYESVIRTVVPLAGSATYKAGGFGFFFGSGSEFWRPKGVGPGYYFGTVAGFWIAGSLMLVLGGVVALARVLRDPIDELIVTCAATHALFVFALFGHSQTWVYDSFFLGVGLALIPSMGRNWISRGSESSSGLVGSAPRTVGSTSKSWRSGIFWVSRERSAERTLRDFAIRQPWRKGTLPLLILAVLAWRTPLTSPLPGWRTHVRTAETAGLWADPVDRAEWVEARSIVEAGGATILATSGCSERFFPEFTPPEGVFLVPGLENEPDVARKARRIEGSRWVVVPKYLGNEGLARWPIFSKVLENFTIIHVGPFYRVYRRP